MSPTRQTAEATEPQAVLRMMEISLVPGYWSKRASTPAWGVCGLWALLVGRCQVISSSSCTHTQYTCVGRRVPEARDGRLDERGHEALVEARDAALPVQRADGLLVLVWCWFCE